MATVGAFAIAFLALGLFAYCEYNRYWREATGVHRENEVGDSVLESFTAQFEAQHKDINGFAGKFQAILRFVHFVLFQSKTQKQERCRRNELTAEKLLLEYQTLVRLPGSERVDRFIRWRDDVADYEARKKAL